MNDTQDKLKQYIERIEYIAEEISHLNGGKRDVFTEAKNNGFDPKAMREVIKRRKMERQEREQFEGTVDTYSLALDGF